MRARIVRIGNSKGIRLPKSLIDQAGLPEEVELRVRDGELVISPAGERRSGWADAARALADRGEDQLLDPHVATEFDDREWEW
ncbi:MAG: AbrB/MazE/SpoVT family DNA-binding domain-containing protein [Candidatus Eisenbacteria bacterium]|nr:AbrB/MazE/SpoVT family DNA-binding domain-containing protein [Candidatus Eisenbacteria bacterium]